MKTSAELLMFFMHHAGQVANEVTQKPTQRGDRQDFVTREDADEYKRSRRDTTKRENVAQHPRLLGALSKFLKDFFRVLAQGFTAGTPALYSGPANFQLSIS